MLTSRAISRGSHRFRVFRLKSRTEIADAPARSCCCAISRYGKSTAISAGWRCLFDLADNRNPRRRQHFSNRTRWHLRPGSLLLFRTSISFFFLFSSTRPPLTSIQNRLFLSCFHSFLRTLLRMSSCARVRADTNPAIEKFFSIFLLLIRQRRKLLQLCKRLTAVDDFLRFSDRIFD